MTSDQINPFQAPSSDSTHSDSKTSKQIENLYRNSNQMIMLTILGVLVPIVLMIGTPLGLLYAFQRHRLLKKFHAGEIKVYGEDVAKIQTLVRRPYRFYAPVILIGTVTLIVSVLLILNA